MTEDLIPPVKLNDEVHITCSYLGKQGDATGRYQGFVIFVPKAVVGKSYQVKITKVFKSFGLAEIIKEE